jgi:hypothetical protein
MVKLYVRFGAFGMSAARDPLWFRRLGEVGHPDREASKPAARSQFPQSHRREDRVRPFVGPRALSTSPICSRFSTRRSTRCGTSWMNSASFVGPCFRHGRPMLGRGRRCQTSKTGRTCRIVQAFRSTATNRPVSFFRPGSSPTGRSSSRQCD